MRDIADWTNFKEKHTEQITGKLIFFSPIRFVQNFHETSSVRCVKIASRVQIGEQQKWERTSLALSAVACCLGSCGASLKYLCLTVPAPLLVCFP